MLDSLEKSNCRFNADANTGHGFAIFMASVSALRASAPVNRHVKRTQMQSIASWETTYCKRVTHMGEIAVHFSRTMAKYPHRRSVAY